MGFSEETDQEARLLRRFLLRNLYQHPEVVRVARKAEVILGDIEFNSFETVGTRGQEHWELGLLLRHAARLMDDAALDEQVENRLGSLVHG